MDAKTQEASQPRDNGRWLSRQASILSRMTPSCRRHKVGQATKASPPGHRDKRRLRCTAEGRSDSGSTPAATRHGASLEHLDPISRQNAADPHLLFWREMGHQKTMRRVVVVAATIKNAPPPTVLFPSLVPLLGHPTLVFYTLCRWCRLKSRRRSMCRPREREEIKMQAADDQVEFSSAR